MKSNRHLETKTLPIALSLLGFVLLFVGGPGPYSSRTFVSFWGLGHLFCFALWSSLYLYWRTPQKPLRQAAEVFLLALALGAATELLQVQFGRQASWQDLGSDILGAFLGLVFSASFKRQLSRYRKLVLQSIVVLIVVWGAGPFFKVAVDDLVAWHQFPVLADFETPLEISRWGGDSRRKIERKIVYDGFASLQVEFNTRRYSGASLKTFPSDWSSYRALRFQIHNPLQDTLEIYFRIHDQQHSSFKQRYSDRFNTTFKLANGWSQIEIPLEKVAKAPRERDMDLTKVAGMIFFVGRIKQPRKIFLDQIVLVK